MQRFVLLLCQRKNAFMNRSRIISSLKRTLCNNQPALTLILCLLIFSSCEKTNFPSAQGTKLVKVIATEDDSVGVSVFKYDENERLVTISQTTNNIPSYHTTLEYDTSGKLVQSEELYKPANSFWRASYTYSNDRIIRRVNSDAFGDTIKNIYTYNSQGKLIADTLYKSGDQNYSYTTFKYNSNENIEELEYFYNYLGTWQKVGTVQGKYNNELNPYNSIGLMYYITKGYTENNYSAMSKNLVTQLITGFGPVDYNYEYYLNGFPKKVLITSHYAIRTKLSIMEFFYE